MANYQELSDEAFIDALEKCNLPGEWFSHTAHCRLAFLYQRRYGLKNGYFRTRKTIQRYAESLGATEKFHATITYACYQWIADRSAEFDEGTSWEQAKNTFSPMIDNGLDTIHSYYSEFLINTAAAKRNEVLPDRKPFLTTTIFEDDIEWREGTVPVVISMPHNGSCIPHDILNTMTPHAIGSIDTDWYLRVLYDFALDLGCYIICPQYSRYVIDLNRPSDGKELYPGANNTELCPTTRFDFKPLYPEGKNPDDSETQRRIARYWQPYHERLANQLNNLQQQYGEVLLFEAHSIASHVPRFFEGKIPDFSLGTNAGRSCSAALSASLESFDSKGYSKVIDQRFKGGYITRHYGRPDQGINAIQLELSQYTYLREDALKYQYELAEKVQPVLKSLLSGLIEQLT